jgi:pimeloyl-ACP methyl ester carboxylesterase
VIITGDRDTVVSPHINARALAATLPSAKLVLLKDVGHMPHHAAPEIVAAAIDDLMPADDRTSRTASRDLAAA